MLEFLIEFKLAIILVIISIFMIVFRKELNKLLDWIVGFRRFSKTKDGYSASTATESSGMDNIPPFSDKQQSAIEKVEDSNEEVEGSKHESNKPDTSWGEAFFAKDYPRACEILRDMISREEDSQKKTEHRAILGHTMFMQDKQSGIKYFDELIRTDGNDATVYYWYGMSFFWDGDYPKAADVLLAGIEQHPKDPQLPDSLASTFQKQSKSFQAIEVLQKNIDQNPTFAKSYRSLAQILVDIDMPEQAINCCKIGMRQCPQDEDLYIKYLEITPKDGSTKERMFAYLRLCKIKPDNHRYWGLLGNEYLELGFDDMAIEAYYKANTLAKEKEAWILANIGNIMKNQGFYTRGAEFLQQAVSIDPNSQYTHERLGVALKKAKEQQVEQDKICKEVDQSIQKKNSLDSLLKQVQEKLSQRDAAFDVIEDAIDA